MWHLILGNGIAVTQGVIEMMRTYETKGNAFLLVRVSRSWIPNPTFHVLPLIAVAKDVNILFDELEAVNSPCKDDDSLLHPGNLTSTSDDASRLEAGGEVRACEFLTVELLIRVRT